ncbi:helix-turn-helix domain-containing protein [Dinghuibacter silviterrae]|uniref:AraC-like DNA-binding protein n=1 Tax=Dinghuibacter silviterrae TaxID=1539049 RepID=A0A4R8DS07_9BACT|nr:helix-turn-helix domain-containing protein [Dinghuibacter silviterrae]TDX00626.1 AraC-like DNA-binding protein [Dinghuibacter silviterrae]
MSKKTQSPPQEDIPYLQDLFGLYKHIKARPPLHKDFDIREIDPEVLKGYDYVAKPFRHSFYCITLFLEGDITLNAGFWKKRINKPALYFKTPCQIVSWLKPERWLKEYFIVFTEGFLLKNKALADLVFGLPFFDMEKAIPFEIDPEEVALLGGLYKRIMEEYRSDRKDKFDLISTYTHALLLHVRRLYHKYVEEDQALATSVRQSEHTLVEKFRALIRKHLATGKADKEARTVKFFAEQLSTHPNHLNAVIKRHTQKTAIAFIHEHILHEATSLLSQTELTIKEISFRLGFNEPSHFNHFFRKLANTTPALYRKERH